MKIYIITLFLLFIVSSVNGMIIYQQYMEEQQYNQAYDKVYEDRIHSLNQTDEYYVIDYDFLIMTRDTFRDPNVVLTLYNPVKDNIIIHRITESQFNISGISMGKPVNLTLLNYSGRW